MGGVHSERAARSMDRSRTVGSIVTYIRTKFSLGNRLTIDGEHGVSAVVTSINMSDSDGLQYKMEWFSNGVIQTSWIAETRLELS